MAGAICLRVAIPPSFSEKEIIETRPELSIPVHITVVEKPEIQEPENNPVHPPAKRAVTREKEELIAYIPTVNDFEISIPKSDNDVLIVSRSSFDGVSTNHLKDSGTGKEKPFVARFITGLGNKLIPKRDNGNKSFIEYTVEGYNMMADKEVEVIRQTDENGNVIAYNVVGDNMQFTRKKRNVGKE